jgi:hypothetical protein
MDSLASGAGLATRPDGRTVEVTIPPREESEGAQLVRLAKQVLAAANVGYETDHWELADLEIALRLQPPPSGSFWLARIGRTERTGATAIEAVTALRDQLRNFNRRGV